MPDAQTLALIVIVGLSTYATRLAGYWLLQGRSITGRTKAALDAVPPAILMAVIAPSVFLQGPAETAAAGVALAAAMLRLPLLVIIAAGVASVALLRHVGM
jgi:uncharacterized membrane protein